MTLAFDAFKEALLDTSGKVASYAIEGLVFLKGHLSSQEFNTLLSDGNKFTDARRTEVEACLKNKTLNAFLNERGHVEIKVCLISPHFTLYLLRMFRHWASYPLRTPLLVSPVNLS